MEEDFAITSLREVAQEHLLTHMVDDCLGHSDGYQPASAAVLVCDDTAAQVISCSIKVDHLVANRSIIAIQSLTVSRQPYQGIEVIYCIAPHMKSIEQVALDWQKGKPPPYSQANIYFLTDPDEAVLDVIREAPLLNHLHSCKVLNLGYAPVDAQGFITARVDVPNASPWIGLNELYGVQSGDGHWNQVAESISKSLMTLLMSVGEIPRHIRYLERSDIARARSRNQNLASEVAKKLNQRVSDWRENQDPQLESPVERPTTVLVMDRTWDMCTPLATAGSFGSLIIEHF